MNEKKTLSHIVDLLVAKYDMDRKDATTFVRGMFELIEEALVTEKFVKVKGLGTFKLTEVEARESVDIHSGERIEIQGHNKVSFIPEAALKELINKPFSQFENVILNEQTELPDTEVVVETPTAEGEEENTVVEDEETPAVEEIASAVAVEETPIVETPIVEEETPSNVETPVIEEETPNEETPNEETPNEETPNEETPIIEKETPKDDVPKDETPNEESSKDEETPKEGTPLPAPTTSKSKWPRTALILIVLLLAGSGLGYLITGWTDRDDTLVAEPVEEESAAPAVLVDSLSALADSVTASAQLPDSAAQKAATEVAAPESKAVASKVESKASESKASEKASEPKAEQKSESKPKAEQSAAPKSAYRIVGTKGVHVLESGETLRIIAEKYYGNRNLSKYIYEHNKSVIANPDRVPAGTKLNIPELEANR
jgi:nucleoid DNA-binding protein